MKLEIYINDKLWKSERIDSLAYQPVKYWMEINNQKATGQLDSFNIDQGVQVKFVPVEDN